MIDERKKFCRMFWLILILLLYVEMKNYKNIACTDFLNLNIALDLISMKKTKVLY